MPETTDIMMVPLRGAPVITTSAAPVIGQLNRYDAAAGALTPILPPLEDCGLGRMQVQKVDDSANAVTFAAADGDAFTNSETALTLTEPGEEYVLEVIEVAGVKYWHRTGTKPATAVLSGDVAEAIADAVPGAVTAEVAGRDMLEGSDPRVPTFGEVDTFRVRDTHSQVALEVTAEGDTMIGPTRVSHQSPFSAKTFRIYDLDEKLAFEVRADGTTFIGELSNDSQGAGAAPVGTVHVILGFGQSNMSGRGRPFGAELDPPDPRIHQFGSGAAELTEATVPLDMVDVPTGLSVLTVIAREYLKRLPVNDVIVLVPAAKGGSLLGASNSEHSSGVWNVDYAGASIDLYAMAKTQVAQALLAVGERWPAATVRVVAMFWHQGETNRDTGDYATTEAQYSGRFDAIAEDLRTDYPDIPIVLGGIAPEYEASDHVHVTRSHIDTPRRLQRVAFAYPPYNGGGSASVTDIVHFHREGVEELGRRMLAALDRALCNDSASVPHPPAVVDARLVDATLTVNWSQPLCRYTGFTVEYREDGGSWTEIPHDTVDTTATETSVTAPVEVRVSTTNANGTSATTTPVHATSGD